MPAILLLLTTISPAAPLVDLCGTDFIGGAADVYGDTHHGLSQVNYIYAAPTGEHAQMAAVFPVVRPGGKPRFLYLTATDDDYSDQCHIRIVLNGVTLLDAPGGFPDAPHWRTMRIPILEGALVEGDNQLLVENTSPEGKLGMPPWFMVARAVIAGRGYRPEPVETVAPLKVRLPSKRRPLPEPLDPGEEPGFAIRGTKGWTWTPEQYLAEIPVIAAHRGNFLMNCYGSLFELTPSWVNRWWEPLSPELCDGLGRVIDSCREHGVTFCFAAHPQLASPRPLDPRSMEDREAFWQRFAWAQSRGVQWFNISIDDVTWGDRGAAQGGLEHADLVNWLLARLRENDPDAQLTMVPVPYWGDGTAPEHRAYLEALAREMHPDVYVFWTGDAVVTPRITRAAAESYRETVGHRLILWDNYPVNDNAPTLHLGPVTGRDPDLCEVIDGYMSNPMCKQNEANRIPLLTCLDYAYNPRAYRPARSIGQALLRVADTRPQRRALADLVEVYPGMLIYGGGTGTNPVRSEYGRLTAAGDGTGDFVARMADLSGRLDSFHPKAFAPAREVLRGDVAWLREQSEPR